MGFTHYWRGAKSNLDAATWDAAIADCDLIIDYARKRIQLVDESSADQIWFNGADEEGHEDFCIDRDVERAQGGRISFCKTAQKPYDAAVVACLAVLAEVGLCVSSDGDEADWKPGLELAHKALGRVVPFPASCLISADL